MHLTLRPPRDSGWLPAAVVAGVTVVILAAYGTPLPQVAIFCFYLAFGVAVPGMLWVRLLRGRAAHISEDLAMGLAIGYCLEIATYVAARAAGLPLLFLAWPIATLIAFTVIPGLRRHWHGDRQGTRAPAWWAWSLAAAFVFVVVYSAASYFAGHHLTGTDTPYVDMPYHLALVAELRHHVPPDIPYVAGVPLAYHWFVYAEAAATSWATGIEPVTLLYRLAGLPMFATFILLTAAAARRLTDRWWAGPVAVAIALLGTVAAPYGWIGDSVYDSQTLATTWTSPTNLFGLALFAATILVFIDLLQADGASGRSRCLLAGLLVLGVAGAKASLLPLLVVGLAAVIVVTAICERRLHRAAAVGLALVVVAFGLAAIVLFRGASLGVSLGSGGIETFPVALSIGVKGSGGFAEVATTVAVFMAGVVLWSGLWAGAFGLLARSRHLTADPPVLMLGGICIGALGALSFLLYPGLSQVYFVRGAAGAFGLLAVAGIAAIVPAGARRGPLLAGIGVAAIIGAAIVSAIVAAGRPRAPRLEAAGLAGVLLAVALPVLALLVAAAAGSLVARVMDRRITVLRGTAPVLVVALVMGFSVPHAVAVVVTPFSTSARPEVPIPADGIAAARWLRDHSDPGDLVSTNLHCRVAGASVCDARHFWIAAYAERHVLVEGWAYTIPALEQATRLGVNLDVVPFWDPALLAANDRIFRAPAAGDLALLRDRYGVRWLYADLTMADPSVLAGEADLRDRQGDFAVYELRRR